jgi:phage terminase large subunit GpA-like protein
VRLPCLDWCRSNIWLDGRFTDREGYYDPTFNPYIIPLHEWFGDASVRSIVVPKGAQLGLTTWLANCMQWAICEEPGPILYVTSTADNAKSWSEREWFRRIESCRPLKKLVPEDRDALRKMEQNFLTCDVKLVGAQSENNLASRPVRYLFADECDKWPAGFLGQAEARTVSYRRQGQDKIAKISTTTDEHGPIWTSWLNSTMHEVNIVCPECDVAQVPDFFTHIKWPAAHRDARGAWDVDAVRRTAHGQCQQCGAVWPQDSQRALVATAHAVQTNMTASAADRGLRLPSVLSPFLTWGDLAAIFLTKKDQPGGMEDFWNNYLARPYSQNIASVKESNLLALRGAYMLGTCPTAPALVTLCADVGDKQTHWSVEARLADGTTWLLDYGTTLSVEDLLGIVTRTYPISGTDQRAHIHTGLVDSGWATDRVYRLCARSGGRLLPAKGSQAQIGTWSVFTPTDYPELTGYTFVDFTAKCSLYIDAIAKRSAPLLTWPANVGQDFIAGHSGQEMREKAGERGRVKFWRVVANDHFGDCSKLHRVCWWILGGGEREGAFDKVA